MRKVAIVTGGSTGLGGVVSRFLAGQDFTVILDGRRAEKLDEARAALEKLGTDIAAIQGDVSDPEHRKTLVAAAERRGRLDLLVNNASSLGLSPLPSLWDYPLAAIDEVFRMNVISPLALIQESLPLLIKSSGLVVNISSDAAQGGYPGWGVYGLSKAALDLASLTLAHELSEKRVSVVSVDPGDMRTDMHQLAFPGQDISDRPLPDVTIPFWAWLLGRDRMDVSGKRFRAQGESWEVGR